jgi:predicted nucleic acid-binding protein
MEYCLDTSVYIQAYKTYYAFDIVPSFWTALEKLTNEGLICSPVAVYYEIAKIRDELSKWAKIQHSKLFVEPDDRVNEILHQIADYSDENYADAHWIRDFLGGADPWVIAHAKAHKLIVVTMEGLKPVEEVDVGTKKMIGRIKIPNMCEHFNVNCITTFDFMRKLKIGL